LERENFIESVTVNLTLLDAFVLMHSYNIFLADQGNDGIDWKESRMLIGMPQRLL
jgi:hypothetical protein